MATRAILTVLLLSSAAVTMIPQSAASQAESEDARTRRRVAELTAYRNSKTYARIGEIQRGIGSISDARELFDLHNSVDLSQEQSKLSPTTELYFFLKAEVLFAQMLNRTQELLPTADALDQLSGYGELRRGEVEDPTVWLEFQILSGMYALQKNRKADAEARLAEFDNFTRRFAVKVDAEYVAQMRLAIASGDLEAARKAYSQRLAIFFPQHFSEITESFDNKIAMMKGMAEK